MSDRRDFFKTAAAAGLALAGTGAQAHGEDNDDFIRTVQRAGQGARRERILNVVTRRGDRT